MSNVTAAKPADPYQSTNADDSDYTLKDKVEDLKTFINEVKFAMMTTRQTDSNCLVSRCMALAAIEGIDLIFHTNTETGKVEELVKEPHVNVSFLKTSTGDWASISGEAEVIKDRELVKKYYSSQLKAWVGDLGDGVHTGGPEDPRIGVIRVKTITSTYSLQKGSAIGRAVEVAKGAVTGKPANVSRLRGLTKEDIAAYKESQAMINK